MDDVWRRVAVWAVRLGGTWAGEVLRLSLLGAFLVSTGEAYLLDRKLNIFSGGYLAYVRIDSLPGQLAFAVVSIVSDLALLAPLVAAVLWVSRLVGLHAAARAVLALGCALGLVAVVDAAIFELHRYLGDVVNLGVLVRLVEGDLRELIHFGAPTVVQWLGPVLLAGLLLVAASGVLHRVFPSGMRREPGARRRTSVVLLLLVITAITVTTAARGSSEAFARALRYKPSGQVWGSLVETASDVDRDGYGLLSQPRDPDPWRADIHPYAAEVPGNGVDEDGIGGDLPAGAPYVETLATTPTFTRRPPVVFVILETFRQDAVGAIVDGQAVTPTLTKLAATQAAVHAFSHNGFTIQSRYHIFTGSLAGHRGRTSLIDDFNSNGYETAFFSAQDESFGQHMDVGFARAGVRYDARMDRERRFTQFSTPSSLTVSWKVLEERVSAWLHRRDARRQLFLHLNYQDGHYPYTNPDIRPLVSDIRLPRSELRPQRREDIGRMYLNTLANVDASLGRVLQLVRETTGEEPAVVVLADHGESLFDHGGALGHGYEVSDVQTRIPFIVHNLPVTAPPVLGQVEVRDLIWQGLGGLASHKASERWIGDGVFQYVGTLDAPTDIAVVGTTGRLTVSLRTERWRWRNEAWQPMASAPTQAVALVHFWEQLRLTLQAGSP